MDTITLIGIISLAVLGVTCGVLALWCKYKDGVIGHIALAWVSLCSLVVVIDALDGVNYSFLPTTSGTFAAMALFMVRHAYRAYRFQK